MAFTFPFCYTPRPEIVAAARRLSARIDADPQLRALFAEGKMLGVLMVKKGLADAGLDAGIIHDTTGNPDGVGFLYAFSGLAGGRNRVEGFVPPIYDLLAPKGHFKQEEARIVALTRRISLLIKQTENGPSDPGSESLRQQVAGLKRERRERSIALQEWIFDRFVVSNARGECLTIAEVFARESLVPPGGTGECAAPKLLQFAYLNGLTPIAMGEFWYGTSPVGELRRAGSFYPSCAGKCGPLLRFMLEGLEVDPDPLAGFSPAPSPSWNAGVQNNPICTPIPVVYEDEALLVIDKPSGLLSVPGRRNPVSALSILGPAHGLLYPCHRLDMDTSGLMVYAKTVKDQAAVQAQFARREVHKTYRATLVAPSPGPEYGSRGQAGPGDKAPAMSRDLSPGARGWIDLPIAPDWYDRPRQKVDADEGKHALTEYEILTVHPGGEIEVRFTPHTGRTHQLRVHAAHPEGLGRPIIGDRLYGGHTADDGPAVSRLLQLRADTLSFRHPRSGAPLHFSL